MCSIVNAFNTIMPLIPERPLKHSWPVCSRHQPNCLARQEPPPSQHSGPSAPGFLRSPPNRRLMMHRVLAFAICCLPAISFAQEIHIAHCLMSPPSKASTASTSRPSHRSTRCWFWSWRDANTSSVVRISSRSATQEPARPISPSVSVWRPAKRGSPSASSRPLPWFMN